MRISAGIAIFWNGRILMAKPANATTWERYTPPKGGVEKGETLKEAASRETAEEVGIYIHPKYLKESNEVIINYDDKKGRVYKRVHLFEYHINELSEIGLTSSILPKSFLQEGEIGDARFLNWEECKEMALKRYLKYIKKKIG